MARHPSDIHTTWWLRLHSKTLHEEYNRNKILYHMLPIPFKTYQNGYPTKTFTSNGQPSFGTLHGSQMLDSPQVLKFFDLEIMWGDYYKKHGFKQDISPLCNLSILKDNDTCLHLLPCCTNKHINNLCTSWHDKVMHAIAQTPSTHPTTRYFTLITVGHIKDKPPENAIPSWLLPCLCYLPRCNCLASFHTLDN